MKSVKNITLVFENCETIDITKAVGDFHIDDITEDVYRVAANAIGKVKTAKTICFQVFGDGEFKTGRFCWSTPFKRILEYNDITGIELTYDDGEKDEIHPAFDGEYSNKNQTSKLYKGDAFIVISSEKTFNSIYTKEVMDKCVKYKKFYMRNDVKALNDLRKNGWKEVFKTDNFMQLYKNEQSIVLSKDVVNIAFLKPYTSYLIDTKTMQNICGMVFDLCYCKRVLDENNLNSSRVVDYESLEIKEENCFNSETTGEITIPFSFHCKTTNSKTDAILSFNRIKTKKREIFEGYIEIGGNRLSTEDIYNFLWLLNNY